MRLKIIFKPCGREGTHAQQAGSAIVIDPRSRIPLAKLLCHEMFHAEHPDWSETRVADETARKWAQMTWVEKGKLYKRFGGATFSEEE